MPDRSPLADYCGWRYINAYARNDHRAMTFWARMEYRALTTTR